MEQSEQTRENLRLAASHIRVLADLLLPSTDLQDVDRAAFAHVLQDLAARLERNLDEPQNGGRNPVDREGRQ